jgi:predicted nuclease with RNAse H fold
MIGRCLESSSADITIIGVDCAAQPQNTGMARATQDGEKLVVLDARCASRSEAAAVIVAQWMRDSRRTLLAVDAPLGWPVKLGPALAQHRAAEPLPHGAHDLFRRATDDVIYERLGKRPLEVAADRIARAAHAALRFLGELRTALGLPVELVWSPEQLSRIGVIEVYPAATRITLGVPRASGSLDGLESRFRIEDKVTPASEHARDAVVCAIGGLEFLRHRTIAPSDEQREQAQHEGWIWAGPAPAGQAELAAGNVEG